MASHEILHPVSELSHLIVSLRGGSDTESESEEYDDDEESSESDVDSDVDSDDEDEDSTEEEYDSDEEYDEEEEEDDDDDAAVSTKTETSNPDDQEYDEVLMPTSFQQLGVTLGVTFISNKLDMSDKRVIKFARFAFLAYVIVTQLFLLYVRFQAKQIDDRTPITINNPLSSIIGSQLQKSEGNNRNDMVKNIASSFLSSKSTVVEYDLKQIKSMNNGLLFPMLMLWFLHFKLNQVQPLFFQTASGFLNLIYSPLFQVYILGRNLERPFNMKRPNPMAEKLEQLQKNQMDSNEEESAVTKEEVQNDEDESDEDSDEEDESDESEEDSDDDDESDEDTDDTDSEE